MSLRAAPDVPRRPASAYALLTRLFLRQFLENDLVSPDADRSQTLAVVGSTVISLTLFISMFMSAPYAMSAYVPGQAAVLTLNDKFFYISLAMLVTALVAAAQWDALALDPRDTAILQPLPVRPATLRLAKLSAVAVLGGAVAIAVNVFPTLVFPWMLAFSVPQMTPGQLLQLMVTHAVVTTLAAVFGYLTVIAVRESASAVLGPGLFSRVSPALQTLTIVTLGVGLLLLPIISTRVAQRGFTGWRVALPSAAFLGLYETATDGFIAELPRRPMTPSQAARDRAMTAIYDERRPWFAPLSRRAQVLLTSVAAAVALATVLNALRRPAAWPAPRRRRRSMLAALAPLLFAGNPAARAGFDFAVATVWRSKAHRLTLACAAAVGLAAVFVALSGVDLSADVIPARLLLIQPLLYGTLLVGFRHLVRVPAELRANWGIRLAWQGRVNGFAEGVKAAAMLTLALPAIVVAMPPIAVVAGLPFALAHAALGVLGAAIVLEALMLSYAKVAFTCSYLPGNNLKALAPIYAGVFLIGAAQFAQFELAILTGDGRMTRMLLLLAVLAGLRFASTRRRIAADVDFDEMPVTYQQLGLYK